MSLAEHLRRLAPVMQTIYSSIMVIFFHYPLLSNSFFTMIFLFIIPPYYHRYGMINDGVHLFWMMNRQCENIYIILLLLF